jgi:hypothetical protein
MPFNIPDNNTNTGNSKKLYLLNSGDSTIDGSLTVNGNLIATEGNILDALNVANLLVAPTINGAGTGAPVKPVSFPMGLSLSPTVYTSVFVNPAGLPFTEAPVTFTPALPAPSASSAGVYALSGVITYSTLGVIPVRYLISGTFINNGSYWIGCANTLISPTILTCYTPGPIGPNPLGTPFLVDTTPPPSNSTVTLNLYRISNVVGVTN